MRWSTQKRIEFIEARLYWEGKVSRRDLIDFFEISVPQATKDIKEYADMAPQNIRYDPSVKHHVVTPNFEPVVSKPSSEMYLTRLRLWRGRETREPFFNGSVPPFAEMPRLRRFVDTDILKKMIGGIRNKEAMEIDYQSMSYPQPKRRWVTPHSLGYDGSRWHVRCFCHNHSSYRDFNLGRILDIFDSKEHLLDHSVDYEWHNSIEVTIAPNPSLNPGIRSCIERDYCMENGEISVEIRAAFYYYFRKQLGFEKGHEVSPGNIQQIIMKNFNEVEIKIELLRVMSKNKINEMKKSGVEVSFVDC